MLNIALLSFQPLKKGGGKWREAQRAFTEIKCKLQLNRNMQDVIFMRESLHEGHKFAKYIKYQLKDTKYLDLGFHTSTTEIICMATGVCDWCMS